MIDWFWIPLTIPPGMIIGYCIAKLQQPYQPPTDENIARFMNKVVNQEEMAEHERLTKFRMARNGRKTQRFDSGPNAKMRKAQIYPRPRRLHKHK